MPSDSIWTRMRRTRRLLACAAVMAMVAAVPPKDGSGGTGAKPPKGGATGAPSKEAPPQPTLELGRAPEPPALGSSNAATEMARTVRAELDALMAQGDAAQPTVAARIALRRLAFDLLLHGASASDQAMAMAGFRLADARVPLDALLSQPIETPALTASVHAELVQFAALAAQGLHPIPPAAQPEVTLAPTLKPLRMAVALLERRSVPGVARAWPSLAEAGRSTPQEPPTPGTEMAVDSDTTAAARLEKALTAARWLSARELEACRAVGTRADDDAERATALAEALTALDGAVRGDGGWDSVRARECALALAAQPSAASLRQTAAVCQAAREVRSFDLNRVDTPLRGAAREVQAQARRSAARLAPLLAKLAAAEAPITDPALSSAAAAQVDARADLARLEAAGAWQAVVAGLHAPAGEPFGRVVRTWAAALPQSAQRAQARASMDAFSTQLAAAQRAPGESELRAGDPAWTEAAGGHASGLLVELDRRRADWAMAWSRNQGLEAWPGLDRALRTMRAVGALAAMQGRSSLEPTVGRWGGFAAPPRIVSAHPRAVAARVQLTVEALVARDDAQCDRHLGALARDMPLTWMVAQAYERLQPWLIERGGVLAQLDAAASAPQVNSWLGPDRAALMQLSRVVRELDALDDAAEDESAEPLRAFVAQMSLHLLRSMEAEDGTR